MNENVGIEVDAKDAILKLSVAQFDAMVDKVAYFVFENRLTVCCVLLENGFILSGESAAFNGATFDAEKGREIAFKNARSKLFMLESYYAKKSQHEAAHRG